HLAYDCRKRVKKSFKPKPVAHRPYRPPMRPVRTNMNGARPNRTSFNKQAHSYANRPFHRTSAGRSHYRALWVPAVNRNFPRVNRKFSTGSRNFPTANRKFPTTSRKFPTGSLKCSTTDMGMKGKAVKPSACWFWKPLQNLSNKGNISYLSHYEPFDGGYVSFGQGGYKITGKGTIKTGKLEFENVYFMKDLKDNLDFKLLDDANILLRTPRQHNMYSIDLNNIVPHRDLTCLVAKASADECMLWHRRLGHLNFKTMNKLVRHNLVRGLPTKWFENDHTCTACLKGKQHKASLTDDFSRFTWTFFLNSKDETSGILKKFITEIENLKDLKVKIIRTLIEAARTMLADAKLPVTFWAEVVNTACYVQNRVLVNKSHNETPYELFNGRSPAIGFLKPFGCHVMILNTLDNLGKFEEKGDEGYFIGYSMSSKAFNVFNKRTRRVEENLNVEFLENKAIEKGASPNWLFDIDSLTKSMNYVPVDADTISTNLSGTKDATSQEVKKDASSLRYIALPNWAHDALLKLSSSKPQDHCSTEVPEGSGNSNLTASTSNPPADPMEILTVESPIPTVSSPVPTVYSTDSQEPSSDARLIPKRVANQEETPSLDNILSLTNWFEDILRVTTNLDESNGVEADISNMETTITASPTTTLRIHKDHPKSKIIGPLDTLIQTMNKSKEVEEQIFIATIHQKTDPALLQFCLFSCFLSQVEPKKISDALQDPSWVEDLKNKKDERGIVIRNKSRLVAQGHTQEEGIDYDEVFAPVARIEGIRLFLAYALFMGLTVYQMDVKSAFLYGTIDEEAPRAWYGTLSKYLLKNGFQRGTIDQTLFIRRKRGDFILVQVYMVDIIFGSSNPQLCREFKALIHEKFQISAMGDILKKFGYSDVRSSNTPMDKENPWGKDGTGKDVDLHLYRSMIGSLMYLIASRPDIMFSVYACARHQVTPNECHMHAVKRIFRYLKGHPKLGIWEIPVLSRTSKYWGILRVLKISLRLIPLDEGSGTPTEPHHTPSPEAQPPSHTTLSSSTLPPSSALPTVADEPESPLRDVSQWEACPTDSGFIADQDRATIAKSYTLPHDSAPRVTSPAANKGCMQHTINELTALCTILQRQHSELLAKFQAQEERSLDEVEAAAERTSDDTKEMATVLTSMDAATVLASGAAEVPTGSGSIPTAGPPAAKVPTGSDVVPTASLVFATATVVTPYRRRIGKEVMVESNTLKKQKVQEQIDAQEYHQFASELPIERRIELISDLVKNKLGWKVKDFRGMTFEEVKAKFNSVWKQMEDFIPMGSKEEAERIKRKGLSLEQENGKKQKTSEEVTKEAKSSDEVPEEKVKEMMQLVPIEEVYVEALQVKHPIIDWKVHTEGQRRYWKITRLGGSSASYQFFIDLLKHLDREDLNEL
nr:hypothetical protein [Tanacetum cinerariifolium]